MSAAIQSMHDDPAHPWTLPEQGWPRVPASSTRRSSGYGFSLRSQMYCRQIGQSTTTNPDTRCWTPRFTRLDSALAEEV